jgi:hypothetical protein
LIFIPLIWQDFQIDEESKEYLALHPQVATKEPPPIAEHFDSVSEDEQQSDVSGMSDSDNDVHNSKRIRWAYIIWVNCACALEFSDFLLLMYTDGMVCTFKLYFSYKHMSCFKLCISKLIALWLSIIFLNLVFPPYIICKLGLDSFVAFMCSVSYWYIEDITIAFYVSGYMKSRMNGMRKHFWKAPP